MTTPNDGGPAFPCASDNFRQKGMSLRDYLAGQALAGYTSHPLADSRNGEADRLAEATYRFADAMLAAREGGDQP